MYIDPGTGSMIIQVLIATLIAGSGTLVIFRGRVKKALMRLKRRKKEPDENS